MAMVEEAKEPWFFRFGFRREPPPGWTTRKDLKRSGFFVMYSTVASRIWVLQDWSPYSWSERALNRQFPAMWCQYRFLGRRGNGLESVPFPTVSAAYKPIALS